ncbi:unnamed protein product [Brassica oleracea]
MATSATGFVDSRDGKLSSTGTPPATTGAPFATTDPPALLLLLCFSTMNSWRFMFPLLRWSSLLSLFLLLRLIPRLLWLVLLTLLWLLLLVLLLVQSLNLRGAETLCTDAVQPSKQSIPFVPSLGLGPRG